MMTTKVFLLLLLLSGCATLQYGGGAHTCAGPARGGYIAGDVAWGVLTTLAYGSAIALGSAGNSGHFKNGQPSPSGGDLALGAAAGLTLGAAPLVLDASTGAWSCK